MMTFAKLTTMTKAELETLLVAGVAPAFSSLVGHEFRGWNVFADAPGALVGKVMGIQRFAKGFFVRGAQTQVDGATFIEGYNVKISRGSKDEAWTDKGNGTPVRHGFYRVDMAGQGRDRQGRYQNALLLDYSQGNPTPGLLDGHGLRDFLVQVDPSNPDLLLGKAYMTIGPITQVAGYFIVERWRKADYSPL
jgi:hypothetical protein